MLITAALLLSATAAPTTVAQAQAAGCKVQHYPTPAVRVGTGRLLTWCPARTASAQKPSKRG